MITILNVITVLVLLAAILSIAKLVNELNHVFNRELYSNMEYNLQDENYGDMVREYYSRSYDVAPFRTFRKLFYENAGDPEQAASMKTRMQDARNGSGKLSVSADDLDSILEEITLFPEKYAS